MPNRAEPTPRQVETIAFIRAYREKHGISPTLAEIGSAMGVSKVSAFENVAALRAKGMIVITKAHRTRNIRLAGDADGPALRVEVVRLRRQRDLLVKVMLRHGWGNADVARLLRAGE